MAKGEAHRMGLLARISSGAYTSQLATQNYISEALREQRLTPLLLDLPATYTSDLPTPATVKEADELDHSKTWRNSGVCECSGLLQARTFQPA